MPFAGSPLRAALVASLLLHALLLAGGAWLERLRVRERPASTPLQVLLRPAEPTAEAERLRLPDEAVATEAPVPRKPARVEAPRRARPVTGAASGFAMLEGEAARAARVQIARELLYPPEAIARGEEGDATVLVFLDEVGDAMAARLEVSSGHPLLDDAAVKAARTLRRLPASVPREVLLPVRFRLR